MGSKDKLTELQLQHRQEMKEKREVIKRRKARTRRLIIRGAIAENALGDGAETMTNEQFQEALSQAMGKSAAAVPSHPQDSRGSALRENPPEGPAEQPSAEPAGRPPRESPAGARTPSRPRDV